MVHRIKSSTVFHRTLGARALIVGVATLDREISASETMLYPMNLGRCALSLEDGRAIEHPFGEPVEFMYIDERLLAKIWPSVVQDGGAVNDRWFFASMAPLPGVKNAVFFYAALETHLFEASGDSWHQLAETDRPWAPCPPLTETIGSKPMGIARSTPWPIDGQNYFIEPNPSRLIALQNCLRGVFFDSHHASKPIEDAEARARKVAIAEGFSPYAVDSMLFPTVRNFEDRDFVAVMSKVAESHSLEITRVTKEADYLAQAAAMRKAIEEIVPR